MNEIYWNRGFGDPRIHIYNAAVQQLHIGVEKEIHSFFMEYGIDAVPVKTKTTVIFDNTTEGFRYVYGNILATIHLGTFGITVLFSLTQLNIELLPILSVLGIPEFMDIMASPPLVPGTGGTELRIAYTDIHDACILNAPYLGEDIPIPFMINDRTIVEPGPVLEVPIADEAGDSSHTWRWDKVIIGLGFIIGGICIATGVVPADFFP